MGIRELDRRAADLPVALQSDPNGPRALGRVVDVSPDGLGVERLPADVPVNAPVFVEIPKVGGRGRVGLLARVAWRDRGRAGLAIEAILPHHRARLGTLLAQLPAG